MSEPQHISEILPGVMADIKDRCNDYRQEHGLPLLDEGQKSDGVHRARVFGATRKNNQSGDVAERHKKWEKGFEMSKEVQTVLATRALLFGGG